MKNYTKYFVILCLISTLSSCAALKAVSELMPSSGISADLQIGDDNNSLAKTSNSIGDVEAKDDATINLNTNTADSHIDSAETVNISEETPWWVFLLIIVPWFLMTPGEPPTVLRI